ncbi:MAG: biosynthetic arginine decarboxylase [Planctomycetota bacterium]|nr:biosynthetic arginine decarboxylase [Planctomycetota bacterium]
MRQDIEEVGQTYGIENWGAGYFSINVKGHLMVHPRRSAGPGADVFELVEQLVSEKKLSTPILLRFPQILGTQLRRLCLAYETASKEAGFKGEHFPVFPMKVNPRREVVEEFLKEGVGESVGVECGSKPELYAALSLDQPAGSLLVCNGFKDEAFVNLALMGVRVGKRVVLVVEKLTELKLIIRCAEAAGVVPWIGLRAKLYSKGSGKWSSSGGEAAKFGLTTSEILECIRLLKSHGLEGGLKLLHFHIGSQVTDIRRIKNAMREAARVYAKIRQMNLGVEYLDIGGGLGVDYDGSRSTFEGSINYSIEEFANNVVYTIKSVCDDEQVPHPHLVTESGRVMTAYHSLLVMSIRDEIETFANDRPTVVLDDDDPEVIFEMKQVLDGINAKNFREAYHDALDDKDELHKGEVLFWEICARASELAMRAGIHEHEFADLQKNLASKYLCNFSLFRSAPDSWAIKQLFPIMPLHRLNEAPDTVATLVDVTCDSDGCIDRFVDVKSVKQVLEMHDFKGQTYYLGLFLIGAYQEVMGSFHNLFGIPNEAQVVVGPDGRTHVAKIIPGSRLGEMLGFARYDQKQVWEGFRRQIAARVTEGKLDPAQSEALAAAYEAAINGTTYLE